MTNERHLRERHRLNLERARDALFEARVILAELERDNSISVSVRRFLSQELIRLEPNQQPDCLEQALLLRTRVRAYYNIETAALVTRI